jgi:hypothetical protein
MASPRAKIDLKPHPLDHPIFSEDFDAIARSGPHTARRSDSNSSDHLLDVVSGGGVGWHCQTLANLSSLTNWHEAALWAWARLETKHASTAITALMVPPTIELACLVWPGVMLVVQTFGEGVGIKKLYATTQFRPRKRIHAVFAEPIIARTL